MAGFHLAVSSDHLIALAEDTANSRVKNGPWAVAQKTDSPFEGLDNIAGVLAVQFLVTFSKNIGTKLRLLIGFLQGRTSMCERLLARVGGGPF